MRTRVQQWLSPPVFPDEEQTRIASVLNLLLEVLILIMLFDAVLLLVFAPETLPTFWLNGVTILASCGLLWLMRLGRVRLAGTLLCLTLWPLSLYYFAISGGITSPSLAFLSAFIVVGVTLFGIRGAIVLGLLNVVGIGVLYVAGSRGLLVSVEGTPTLARFFVTNSVFYLLLTSLVAISGHSVYKALTRARNAERALAERNRELQHEIVERKQAQEALVKERNLLRSVIDILPDNIFMKDKDGRFLLNNVVSMKLLGASRQEDLLGKTDFDFFPHDVAAYYWTKIEQLVRSGQSIIDQEEFQPWQSEQWRWQVVTVIPLRGEQGEVTGLVGRTTDITRRKQAENVLRQYATRLNTLHQIDRALLAALSPEEIAQTAVRQIRRLIPCQAVMMGVVDRETNERVLLAADTNGEPIEQLGKRYPLSSRWQETFDQNQLVVIPDLQTIPASPPKYQKLLERGMRSFASIPLILHNVVLGALDLMATEPDAFTLEHLDIGREVADQLAIALEHAQLTALVQRHAAELEQRVKERTEQLEVANAELRVLSQVKDQFVSNVSHELRTPITNLKLRQYLLAKQPDRVDVHLPVMQRETDRLARIIEDLLALSRLDQDRTPLKLTEVDLNTLIQQFITDRVPLAESRGLHLSTTFAPETLWIQVDAGLIEQVLSVLLTNALNYTPRGGQVIVSTHLLQLGSQWWAGFRVCDTGLGISKEEQGQIFVRFFRGQAGRESHESGTGLGLALAKEIVDRHHGRIVVESEGVTGKGTTFTVWLLRGNQFS